MNVTTTTSRRDLGTIPDEATGGTDRDGVGRLERVQQKFNLMGSLVDGDGNLIEVDGPDGRGAITLAASSKQADHPGYRRRRRRCCPSSSTVAPGIQLRPGSRYEWRVEIDTKPNPTIGLLGSSFDRRSFELLLA